MFLIAALTLAGTELVVEGVSSMTHAEESSDGGISQTGPPADTQSGTKESLESPDMPATIINRRPAVPLRRFFQALQSLRLSPERSQVRVAYFGDSMIEGDLVSQTLRHNMQKLFGGEGVGYVPATSSLWGFRKTIKHRFNESQWSTYNVLGEKPTGFEFGISGELFLTKGWSPWITFSGTDAYPETSQLHQARLFYGPPAQKNAYLLVDAAGREDTTWLSGKALVNSVVLADSCGETLGIKVVAGSDFPVYGVSMESPNGLIIDNFGMRSSAGSQLSKINEESLALFQDELKYNLVILQFGLNLVSAERTDYSRYETSLTSIVAAFKTAMPGADILIVSVGDKCTRQHGHWQTDPSVPHIIASQQRVAKQTDVGFLNLFEQMGGPNAMVQWVNSTPSLARRDYAHPTRKGAEKVAGILYRYLLDGYQTYTGEENLYASQSASPP